MNAMPLSTLRLSRLLALALVLAPAVASAQSLPKGYASDESPTTPVAASTTTSAAASSPAPAMKVTAGEDASATATAQISTSTDEYTDTDPSALTDFQEPLQGYGSWVNDDSYGTVWVPDTTIVGSDFAPYQTGGYWSMTDDDDWLWVSTYDWGYIPFHYGRWVWISGRGWSWIPGRVYAPSWVSWRVSDYGYIGWAPLAPTYYWVGGAAYYFATVPAAAYVFCPTSYVFHTSVHSYVVHDHDTVSKIASHSRNYTPASPTASNGTHKSADAAGKSSGGKAGIGPLRTKGPSLKAAGVPDSAAPTKRGSADSRAAMFSKKSTTARAKTLVKSQRTAAISSAGSAPVARAGTTLRGGAASFDRSATVTPAAGASRSAAPAAPFSGAQPAARASAPVVRTPSTPAPSRGSFTSAPSAGSRVSVPSAGSRPSAPVYYPRASAPQPSRSMPSAPVSAPRASTPRISSPSPVSAPRVSTPHFSGGGGGVRMGGGGGGRHHR